MTKNHIVTIQMTKNREASRLRKIVILFVWTMMVVVLNVMICIWKTGEISPTKFVNVDDATVGSSTAPADKAKDDPTAGIMPHNPAHRGTGHWKEGPHGGKLHYSMAT